MFFFNHELNQPKKNCLDICKWFHQLSFAKNLRLRWLRAGTGLSHAIGRTFPYEGGERMGSVEGRCLRNKKTWCVLRCRGSISKPFGVIFFGELFLVFSDKIFTGTIRKKNISRIIYGAFFFFKMSCGFGMVCGFIEVCFSLRISGETELWRTNLWVAGDREVTTVISSIYPPTQGCQIQSWHFKRLKFGIPEAKHIYPQDPWDDLYIYLHLVVFLMVDWYIVILVIFEIFAHSGWCLG